MTTSTQVDINEAIDDIVSMLKQFVRCRMYAIIDRIANATGGEVAIQALYEALRASRSALESGTPLCEIEEKVGEETKKITIKPYVARESSVSMLVKVLTTDLVQGLELCKQIAVKALAIPTK